MTFVNPANTSQACSGCGEMVPKDLTVRVHACPNSDCLLELDRDENAARNILKLALRAFADHADQRVGRSDVRLDRAVSRQRSALAHA